MKVFFPLALTSAPPPSFPPSLPHFQIRSEKSGFLMKVEVVIKVLCLIHNDAPYIATEAHYSRQQKQFRADNDVGGF